MERTKAASHSLAVVNCKLMFLKRGNVARENDDV